MSNEDPNEDLESLLKNGIEAAKAKNKPEARRLLEKALEIDDTNQAAWMWLATVVDKPSEKRICLENVLELNPNNMRAREALEQLGPAPAQPAAPPEQVGARTFGTSSVESRQAPSRPRGRAAAIADAKSPAPGTVRARQRRRTSPALLIGGGAFAIGLIIVGLLLAANLPGASPTPTAPAAVAGIDTTSAVTIIPQGTVVTSQPVTVVPATATTTDTPFPTLTPSATLAPVKGYKLLFTGEGRGLPFQTLYTMQGDGQGEKRFLSDSKGAAFAPALSRTGKVAYIGIDGDKQQLFVTDQTGQNARSISKLQAKVYLLHRGHRMDQRSRYQPVLPVPKTTLLRAKFTLWIVLVPTPRS